MSEAADGGAPQRKRSRFNWVTFLIVVAVVGIVVAVLLPTYGDYSHRAQASEAIGLMAGAKTPLAEYFADKEKWPGKLQEVVTSASGKYTQSVAITKGAGGTGEIEITATMKTEGVDRHAAGAKIRLFSADGGKTWTCRSEPDRQTILPAACRDRP
jgi:type IV pilus assembly protein PilA